MKRTVFLTAFFVVAYILLQYFLDHFYYYTDSGCGCSSGCEGFYLTKGAKYLSYGVCLVSIAFTATWMRRRKTAYKLLSVIGAAIFICSLWCGGFMYYYSGGCGNAVYIRQGYLWTTRIGELAKKDDGSINEPDSKENSGKLLGFYNTGNQLIIYRFGQQPVSLKMSCFGLGIDTTMYTSLKDQLGVYVDYNNLQAGNLKLTGGQDMPEVAFLQDIARHGYTWYRASAKKKYIPVPQGGYTSMEIRTQ